MSTAKGNHGSVEFDDLGRPTEFWTNPLTPAMESYDYITHFNVSEYVHTYGQMDDVVDIVDIGYWWNMGERNGYEPPSEDYREEIKRG